MGLRIGRSGMAAIVLALVAAVPADAATGSLYSGPGPRPGPDLLYAPAATAPQLTNTGIWKAPPILVSGTTAYRSGEFLYQDYLYDDWGAQEQQDPSDPKAGGNLFSKPNGTYTYPTDARYANDAADFVELRVKPLRSATAFRVTLNTLRDPSLIAFSIAIGSGGGHARPFPDGANVSAPADLFLTVHPAGSRLVGDLTNAATGRAVAGPAPTVVVDMARRQIEVRVPHRDWNPRRHTVRLAAGVGLWDSANNRYLLPQVAADSSHPGGAGASSDPAAFFNVAFRTHEPMQKVTDGTAAVTDAAWWRDRAQGHALASHDISQFHANVSFARLARRVTDNRGVPKTGPMDRILPSHFEVAQGADFSQNCLSSAANCPGQYQGRLQPYAIYIPRKSQPPAGYGMTLLLHSLSASYNQYLGSRNQSQFGERDGGSIVITPESRGPDENYENYGAADVFDVWNDVARRYRLNPDWTVTSGYSMGGVGSFKLGSQFPDLFARAQPTVGFESNPDVLASLRNVPVLMWNNHGDELADEALFESTASKLDSLGYRYETDAFQPCANTGCSPLFPNHLQLAINDEYAPAAAFLGDARVERDPAHVTYVLDQARNHSNLGLVGDHAYWISGLKLRDPSHTSATGDPEGQVDAVSHGLGAGDPVVSPTEVGTGTLTGGNFGALTFTRQQRTWTSLPAGLRADEIDVNATNISAAAIDVSRAHVDCNVVLKVTTDGPIAIALPACGRTVHAG
jgi:predicted esterase